MNSKKVTKVKGNLKIISIDSQDIRIEYSFMEFNQSFQLIPCIEPSHQLK